MEGIKPGASSVVIGYQDLLTSGWQSVLCLIIHLPCIHEQGVNNKSLPAWTQGLRTKAGAEFEHGHHSILTNSIKTPELNASFGEPDAITSSVSWVCILGSTISDNSQLVLSPGIKPHK